MKSSNHCTGETIHLHSSFFVVHWSFSKREYDNDSISEHGNLAIGGIFNSKTLQNLYTKVVLIFSVWICEAIYEARAKTLASILMEWIERQEELNQLKL